MIRRVYSKRHRNGWAFDAKKGEYYSWKFDIRYRDGSGRDRRKKQGGFISEAEARTAADKFTHAALQSRYGIMPLQPAPTLAQLVSKHLPQIQNRRERVRAERILNLLLTICGKLMPVDELHSSHLLSFIERQQRDGLSPSSIDRHMNIISTMLHAAPDYFPALSQWRCPRIPRPKVPKRRRERVIKVEEITRLLTWLYRAREADETEIQEKKRRNVAHVFRMALLTASRKGEICRLRWDQIDWQAGTFQLIGSKTEYSQATTARYPKITNTIAEIFRERWVLQNKGVFPWQHSSVSCSTAKNQARLIGPVSHPLSVSSAPIAMLPIESSNLPLTPEKTTKSNSGKWLSPKESSGNPECRYVFTSNGNEVTDYYNIMADACRALGLLYGRKTLGGFVTHDTRHTAVSYLLGMGYDLKTIGDLTGHSDKTMVLLYSHTKRETVEAAYDALDRFAGTGTIG